MKRVNLLTLSAQISFFADLPLSVADKRGRPRWRESNPVPVGRKVGRWKLPINQLTLPKAECHIIIPGFCIELAAPAGDNDILLSIHGIGAGRSVACGGQVMFP